MQILSKKMDQHLIDLAWSLWTELGVAGVRRQHQYCLIALEELILLTAIIAEVDPRLRDEALDWCAHYHHFVSISRLRALIKAFGQSVIEPFSIFAATLNLVSRANWPVFTSVVPLKFMPSGKSMTPRCELPALLNLRLRALFGVGARADLITFYLTHDKSDFTASDTTEIGYSKRNLADLLDNFVQSGFFDVFTTRNQRNYCFIKRDQMTKVLGLFPKFAPSWRLILEVLLPLRNCIQQIENKSGGTKVTEIRNVLMKIENKLRKLNLTSPPMQSDLLVYWDSFADWILKIVRSFAQGDFEKNQEIAHVFSWDEQRDAARRIRIQFNGLFLNVESLSAHLNDQAKYSLFENYKRAFQEHLNVYLPKLHTDDQKKIRDLASELLSKDKNSFTPFLEKEVVIYIEEILEKYL